MKKIFLTVLTIITVLGVNAQGSDLIFSRVIDTTLSVTLSSCTNTYTSKTFGASITVPSNKVWKITSYSNVSTFNSSTNPNDWDDNNLFHPSYNCSGLIATGNTGFKSDILKNVNGDYIVIFPSGSTNTLMPVWINAGTELKASFYSGSSSYQWTWQGWLPYVSHVNLSIIEFYVVPIE